MTPEGRVKKAVKDRLNELGIWNYWPVSNGMGVHGIPDCIACYNGVFLGLELKPPGKRNTKRRGATALQVKQLKGIRDSGGYAAVIDSVKELEELLRVVMVGGKYDFEKTITRW